MGLFDEAHALIDGLAAGMPSASAEMRLLGAYYSLLAGDVSVCGPAIEALIVDGQLQLSMSPLRPLAVAVLAVFAARVGDAEAGAVALEELEDHSDDDIVVFAHTGYPGGSAARGKANALAAMGRSAEAAEMFERAIELEERFDAPALAYLTKIDYADMLLRSGAPADRDRALAIATELLEGARLAEPSPGISRFARRLLMPPLPVALATTQFFVGRGAELDLLQQQWQAAVAGERRAVLLAGEPGIGKTRLAEQVAQRAHNDGAAVLFGRCDEDLGVAYQPFVEAIGAYVEHCAIDELRAHVERYGSDLARLVPELFRRVPEAPPLDNAEPEDARFRMFEAVVGFLQAASEHAPVVLVLDDLHWATKPTLLLLRRLLRADESGALLVVATYRDTDVERSHPLAELIADLRRQSGVERIALRGLDEDETGEFIAAAGQQEFDEQYRPYAVALHQNTEGNPFFMLEVLRHLTDTGTVFQADGRWTTNLASPDDVVLPEGIRDVITRRLARLSDTANRALSAGAVIGPRFSHRLLEAVLAAEPAKDGESLLDALDSAVRAGVLADHGGEYAFSHALTRQTLYAELTSSRRIRLHRTVAETIEATSPTELEALAFHFAECAADGQAEKAAEYALAAGRRALEHLAFEEAVSILERGIDAVALVPHGEFHVRLLLASAGAQRASGSGDTARARALDAAAAARETHDAAHLALAAAFLTSITFVAFVDPEAAALCEEALALLGEDGPGLRARVLAGLAHLRSWHEVGWGGVVDDVLQAVALAEETGDPETQTTVLLSAMFATRGTDQLDVFETIVDRLIDAATESSDARALAEGLAAKASLLIAKGDADGARRLTQRLDTLAAASRSWVVRVLTAGMHANLALLAGDFEAVPALVATALSEGPEDFMIRTFEVSQLAFLMFERGQLDELRPWLAQPLVLSANGVARASVHVINVYLDALAGDEDAGSRLVELVDELDSEPRDGAWSFRIAALCMFAHLVSNRAVVERLRELLEPFAGQLIVISRVFTFGAADRYLGMLDAVADRDDDAERRFAAALELERRAGAEPAVARTRLAQAQLVLKRGDREQAAEYLRESLEIAERLDMAAVSAEVRTLLGAVAPS
jgi:tetratricopeptide (TPR) repeat protein